MTRLLFAAPLFALGLVASGCTSSPGTELSKDAICQEQFKNDPAGYDLCMQSAYNHGSAPQADPHQLPLRTGQPSD